MGIGIRGDGKNTQERGCHTGVIPAVVYEKPIPPRNSTGDVVN